MVLVELLMDCELSDAILMDAIGMAKSFKSKESLTNMNCKHFAFGDYIASQINLTMQRMVLSIENSQSKFNNSYEILQSLMKDVKLEKDRQNDFDNLVKLWASEIDENDNLLPEFDLVAQKEAKDSTIGDNMRKELADLADTMKGRALTYKEILMRDNDKLHHSAVVQQKELERIQMENQRSKAMEK